MSKVAFSPMQVCYLSCDFVTSFNLGKLHLEQYNEDMFFFSMVHISLSGLLTVLLEYQIKMCKLLWIYSLRVVFLSRFVFILRKRLSLDFSRFRRKRSIYSHKEHWIEKVDLCKKYEWNSDVTDFVEFTCTAWLGRKHLQTNYSGKTPCFLASGSSRNTFFFHCVLREE